MASLTQIEGKYEILEKLHEGGMGSIYLVQHRLLQEQRVVKTMRRQLAEDAQFRGRFLQEAQLAASLKHPNIAQIHDFTVDDNGTGFIVMEHIEGVSLKEILTATGAPGLEPTLEISRQALRALGFLHRKGYVHRDISPDNVMLSEDVDGRPEIKLIDLGIAKKLGTVDGLTTTGHFLGKLRYSSPEHFGEKGAAGADERSDVYSFGLVLYELLTGQPAVLGNDLPSLSAGHLLRPPLAFDKSDPLGLVPEELRQLVLRALEKDPAARFADAELFAEALGQVQARHQLPPDFAVAALLAPAREQRRKRLEAAAGGSTQVRFDRQFHVDSTPGGRAQTTDIGRTRKTEIRLVRHEEPSPDEDTGVYDTISGKFATMTSSGTAARPTDAGRTQRIPDIAAHLASAATPLDPAATITTPPAATTPTTAQPPTFSTETNEATSGLSPTKVGTRLYSSRPEGAATTKPPSPAIDTSQIPETTRLMPVAGRAPESERRALTNDPAPGTSPGTFDEISSQPPGDHSRDSENDPSFNADVVTAWEEGLATAQQTHEVPPLPPLPVPEAAKPAATPVSAGGDPSGTASGSLPWLPQSDPADPRTEADTTDPGEPSGRQGGSGKDEPTGWASRAGEILIRFPALERLGLDLFRLRALLSTAERHRLKIGGALAGVAVLALVLAIGLGGGEGTPVVAPPPPSPPPEVAPPPPPPVVVVETEPALHPELVAARSCLAEGDAECARLAIETLSSDSVYLTDTEREELAAVTAEVETIEAAIAESTADIESLGQKLVDALANGPVTTLRDAVDAMKKLRQEDPEAFDSFAEPVTEAFAKGDKIIIEYRRMWGFKNKGSHFEVIPLTERLMEIYPPYTDSAKEHRDTAAAAVEAEAAGLEDADDFLGAASLLRVLREVYPDRAGLAQHIAELERRQKVDEKVEKVLASAEDAHQQRKPEEGLAVLDNLKLAAGSPYTGQVTRLRSRLEKLLETMDRSPPVITLAPGQELTYKRRETIHIELSIIDEYRVALVTAYARPDTRDATYTLIPTTTTTNNNGSTYVMDIGPELHDNKKYVYFYVEAIDPSGHSTSFGTATQPKIIVRKGIF